MDPFSKVALASVSRKGGGGRAELKRGFFFRNIINHSLTKD